MDLEIMCSVERAERRARRMGPAAPARGVFVSVLGSLLAGQPAFAEPPELTVRPAAEVEWTALNPARGEASPRAATLWGDRATSGPSGFLVRFADGFASPPHIHNVSYRAVVISGEVHNDDPGASPMWMSAGSFWTQPRAEGHITSSRGVSTAYVEIDDGPYLVHPVDRASVVPEKPVNLDAANLVWTSGAPGVEIARLWGAPDDGAGGIMVRVAAGRRARIQSSEPVRAIVLAGEASVPSAQPVDAGSLFAGTDVPLHCGSDEPCTFYARVARGFTLSRGR